MPGSPQHSAWTFSSCSSSHLQAARGAPFTALGLGWPERRQRTAAQSFPRPRTRTPCVLLPAALLGEAGIFALIPKPCFLSLITKQFPPHLPAPPTPGPPCQGLFNCPRRSRSECLASTVHEVVSGCFSHPESFPLVLCFSNSVTSPPWCGLCHPPMTGTLLISWAPPVRLLWGPTRSSFLAFERALGVDADVLVLCE